VSAARERYLTIFVIAVAATACSEKKPAPKTSVPAAALPLPPQPQPPAPVTETRVIPPATHQLITAITDSWTSTHATMQLWTRTEGGTWTASTAGTWPVILGGGGSAWGIGIHPAPPPRSPLKQDGDNPSPAGAFALRDAYGYADAPPKGTKLEYSSTGRGDYECIDDPGSEHYASIVDRKQVAADWESSESLLIDNDQYKWIIDVAHNPERTAKAGSCIFLHVWKGPEATTSGCTAMEEIRLEDLLRTLDPAAKPMFVLLPRAEYQTNAVAWGLPPT
jgi:L,D-peptidoglycan transpeptidase YkuD (ErfK/YbiS/YcfS/YnhG family)